MDQMNTIAQKNEFGCSIACLAMILGVSYCKSREQFRSLFIAKDFGDQAYFDTLLDHHGFGIEVLVPTWKDLGIEIDYGQSVSDRSTLHSQDTDGLVYGWLIEVNQKSEKTWELGSNYDHWAIWDATEKIIRDPCLYQQPFQPTLFYPLSIK